MKTNELPTHEEIEATSPDERDALFADVRAGHYSMRKEYYCPVSGMGRAIADWDECRLERCMWYVDTDDGFRGCAVWIIAQSMPY